MTDGFFTGQGVIASIMGGGQLIIYYFIASALTGMFPSWSTVIWAVAALFGLEALIMLGFGLIMVYAGVKD